MCTRCWRQRALLGIAFFLLMATVAGCRGMLPAQPGGVATPVPRAAGHETRTADEVVLYLVTSDEQARLLREQVSADNDSRGRHDLVFVVGASQALIINAAALRGGLPRMRQIDLKPGVGVPGQLGGAGAVVQPVSSP